jgi:hypothetical protein
MPLEATTGCMWPDFFISLLGRFLQAISSGRRARSRRACRRRTRAGRAADADGPRSHRARKPISVLQPGLVELSTGAPTSVHDHAADAARGWGASAATPHTKPGALLLAPLPSLADCHTSPRPWVSTVWLAGRSNERWTRGSSVATALTLNRCLADRHSGARGRPRAVRRTRCWCTGRIQPVVATA